MIGFDPEENLHLEEDELDADTTLHPNELDIAWLEQSRITKKYGKLVAYLEALKEYRDERMKVVWAEMDKKIRNNPAAFGISKLTEGALAAAIRTAPEYKKAHQAYLDALYEYKMCREGAVKAVDHRKTALENLVKLHGQQYFAGPNVPRDLDSEWQAKRRDESANRKVRMRRTKRGE